MAYNCTQYNFLNAYFNKTPVINTRAPVITISKPRGLNYNFKARVPGRLPLLPPLSRRHRTRRTNAAHDISRLKIFRGEWRCRTGYGLFRRDRGRRHGYEFCRARDRKRGRAAGKRSRRPAARTVYPPRSPAFTTAKFDYGPTPNGHRRRLCARTHARHKTVACARTHESEAHHRERQRARTTISTYTPR